MALQDILLGLFIIGVPILLLISRTHATLFLLMLFAGASLARAAGDEVSLFVGGFVKLTPAINHAVLVAVFFLPAIIMALHYSKSAGRKMFAQLLPISLSGLTALFLGLPLLPESTQYAIVNTSVYRSAAPYEELVITAAVLSSMLVAVIMYKRPKKGEGKEKHGHHK